MGLPGFCRLPVSRLPYAVFLLFPVPCNLFPGQWCERGDSNPHPLRDQILSLARLPIPPLSRGTIIRQAESTCAPLVVPVNFLHREQAQTDTRQSLPGLVSRT